ncbi:unnamed protein product [Caenorhabditis nigoni]
MAAGESNPTTRPDENHIWISPNVLRLLLIRKNNVEYNGERTAILDDLLATTVLKNGDSKQNTQIMKKDWPFGY